MAAQGCSARCIKRSYTAAAPQGWLAKVPGLYNTAGREAVAGSGAAVKAFAGYAAWGNPNTYQGAMDHFFNAPDKRATYDSTQKPLQDYEPVDPDDVGTTADGVAAQPDPGDGAHAATPPADVKSAGRHCSQSKHRCQDK